jgi:membrane-bound metal-dependent hydrolase YbcI (DUF457 family)
MRTQTASIIASLVVGILVGMLYDARVDLRRGNILVKLKNIIVNKKGLVTTIALVALSMFIPETGASIIWGLLCGWLLHIFEDLFNYKGCPILYPLSKAHIHVASFKTRHWSEGIFLLLWMGGCALWAFAIVAGR